MSNKQNWKLGFGLLAGAVVGYWLNSDQGRRVRAEAHTTANEYGEKAAEFAREQANQLNQTTQEYYEQGKEAVNAAATKVKNAFVSEVDEIADEAENAVDSAENQLKKGINKARKNVTRAANNS